MEIIGNVYIGFLVLENPILDTKFLGSECAIDTKFDISELNYPLISLITLISGHIRIGEHWKCFHRVSRPRKPYPRHQNFCSKCHRKKVIDISELNYPLIRLITLISDQLMIGDHWKCFHRVSRHRKPYHRHRNVCSKW